MSDDIMDKSSSMSSFHQVPLALRRHNDGSPIARVALILVTGKAQLHQN